MVISTNVHAQQHKMEHENVSTQHTQASHSQEA